MTGNLPLAPIGKAFDPWPAEQTPVDQAAAASSDTKTGDMPEWDLTDLFPGPQSEALKAHLEKADIDPIADLAG